MAINYHQPSVNALFDAMPWPILTFGVNGLISYSNQAAKVHPGKPVEAMSGKPVIKSLVKDVALSKVKLPYKVDVELADGNKAAGVFMAGPSGLDIAFVIQDVSGSANRETICAACQTSLHCCVTKSAPVAQALRPLGRIARKL